jgi:tRNA-modifying protein YgfZ
MDTSPPQTQPEDFGDPEGEYQAARAGVAVIDLPAWTQIDVSGNDRVKFLHNFCTNDIRSLAIGRGCEAFITNVQGKVLAHVFVFADEFALHLIAVPGCAGPIIKHLSRYQISEDVTFEDRTSQSELILVAGPLAAKAIAACGNNVESLEDLQTCRGGPASHEAPIFRNDFLSVPGYLVACHATEAAVWRTQLVAAGAVPAGHSALSALRIEAGFPLYGVDITDNNLAQEVGRTAQAISFAKGCYLGQEPIARIDALGHVNQQLRGLRLQASPLPPAGAAIVTAEDRSRKIGQVTSATFSYAAGAPIALGYLKRHYDTPDLEVVVEFDGNASPACLFWPSIAL